ncbi:MAG: hypothetical protein ACK4R8_09060 [Thiobacillus sp.]
MSKLLSTLVAASMIGAFSLSAVAADTAQKTVAEKPAAAPHAAGKMDKASKHKEAKAESKAESGKK